MPKRLLPYNEQKCRAEFNKFFRQSLMIFEHLMWNEYGWPVRITGSDGKDLNLRYRISLYRQVTLEPTLENMTVPKYKM
jgi:hypothetical protein